MREVITQLENYACTGGTKEFNKVAFSGRKHATVQVVYNSLNANDSTLTIEQSLDDGLHWDVINGASFNLLSTKTSHTFNIVDIKNNWLRLTWTVGSVTAGTIEKITWLFD